MYGRMYNRGNSDVTLHQQIAKKGTFYKNISVWKFVFLSYDNS